MKTKRPKPRLLPSGNWNVEFMVDGKRYSVTDEDPAIAQAKAMAMQAGVIEKTSKTDAITLQEAIDTYIEKKRDTLSGSTIRGYAIIRRHRFKRLMGKNIWSISKADVQKAVDKELKSGLNPKTVNKAYGLVRPALKMFGIDVSGVEIKGTGKVEPRDFLQIDEIDVFLECVSKDTLELEILVAIWLGMRRSEIFGLCWDCVDEENSRILIKRAWVPDEHGKFILQERTKNKSSNRWLSCPPYIMDKLKARRNGQTEGRIFTCHPDTLLKHIHRICREAGITDTSTHGLRHTFAAVMQRLEVPDNVAMKKGGWTEEKTYKGTYSYVFEQIEAMESSRIDDFYMSKLNSASKDEFSLHCRKTQRGGIFTVECKDFPGVIGKGRSEDDATDIFCTELFYFAKSFCWAYNPRQRSAENGRLLALVLKIVALDAEEIRKYITWME